MEDSNEKYVDAAPANYKELIAEVKYSDMPVQSRKTMIDIILDYACKNRAGGQEGEKRP